jgi:hypothetical protein
MFICILVEKEEKHGKENEQLNKQQIAKRKRDNSPTKITIEKPVSFFIGNKMNFIALGLSLYH